MPSVPQNVLTLDINMNLSGAGGVEAIPADIVGGLAVVESAVAGLDGGDGVNLSYTDKLSVLVQAVSTVAHRWVSVAAAGQIHRAFRRDAIRRRTHCQCDSSGSIWFRRKWLCLFIHEAFLCLNLPLTVKHAPG